MKAASVVRWEGGITGYREGESSHTMWVMLFLLQYEQKQSARVLLNKCGNGVNFTAQTTHQCHLGFHFDFSGKANGEAQQWAVHMTSQKRAYLHLNILYWSHQESNTDLYPKGFIQNSSGLLPNLSSVSSKKKIHVTGTTDSLVISLMSQLISPWYQVLLEEENCVINGISNIDPQTYVWQSLKLDPRRRIY